MPRTHPTADADAKPLWKRLAWLALYWLAGVAAVGAVAMVIRVWLKA